MRQRTPYFFVSYSHRDQKIVRQIVDALIDNGVNIWLDTMLHPGENWQRVIEETLRRAAGIIVFVSQASAASEWVMYELRAIANKEEGVIIPVILEHVSDLPYEIRSRQWIDVSGFSRYQKVGEAVLRLTRTIADFLSRQEDVPSLEERAASEIASSVVKQARGEERPVAGVSTPPDAVFVVHGHDLQFLAEVENFLTTLGIKAIVLSKMPNAQRSLLEKFLSWSKDVRFAVVLVSADDRGVSRRQYDPPKGVGERALQFRARQNVILELGFFYGYLGWENVFVLFKPPDEIFPNFETPSDLNGVPFDEVDPVGRWKTILKDRLRQAGFAVP